jgi:DNA-binding NtrC family response regulator
MKFLRSIELTENNVTILIVDDEEDIRQNIIKTLDKSGYAFLEAGSANELRHTLSETAVDVIILDLRMPDSKNQFMSYAGLESLRHIKNEYPTIPVIIFSAMSPAHQEDARRLGAYTCIEKTGTLASIKELRNAVREALHEKNNQVSQTPQPIKKIDIWQLSQTIISLFNIVELQELCFKMDINYDLLEGNGLQGKTQSLITYTRRHQRLSELIQTCKLLRPNAEWE